MLYAVFESTSSRPAEFFFLKNSRDLHFDSCLSVKKLRNFMRVYVNRERAV